MSDSETDRQTEQNRTKYGISLQAIFTTQTQDVAQQQHPFQINVIEALNGKAR